MKVKVKVKEVRNTTTVVKKAAEMMMTAVAAATPLDWEKNLFFVEQFLPPRAHATRDSHERTSNSKESIIEHNPNC